MRAVEAKDRARAAAASEVARAEPEMSSAMSAKEANVLVEALIAEKRALVADSKALSDVFEAYKAEANALDEQVRELRTRRSLLKRKQVRVVLGRHAVPVALGNKSGMSTARVTSLGGDILHVQVGWLCLGRSDETAY